ncbi:MAG: hypothetical protein ABSG55_01085 [Dehalococcoidia bacterium]
MAIALVIEFPGVRREQYDNVMKELRLDEGGTERPTGMILHLAGPYESGWQVVDVWETRADFDRFLDRDLGRALKNASIGTPRVREFSVYKALGLPKTVAAGAGGMRS